MNKSPVGPPTFGTNSLPSVDQGIKSTAPSFNPAFEKSGTMEWFNDNISVTSGVSGGSMGPNPALGSVGPGSVGAHSVGPSSLGPQSIGPAQMGANPFVPGPMSINSMGSNSMMSSFVPNAHGSGSISGSVGHMSHMSIGSTSLGHNSMGMQGMGMYGAGAMDNLGSVMMAEDRRLGMGGLSMEGYMNMSSSTSIGGLSHHPMGDMFPYGKMGGDIPLRTLGFGLGMGMVGLDFNHPMELPPMILTEKIVIRWPHPSFRFMFLGEYLKRSLNEELQNLRSVHGITTVCPHREKNDQAACLLLEGPKEPVTTAAEEINGFMRAVLRQMRCVQLILSETQRRLLISGELAKVKEIQGQCGVHIVLEPLSSDINEASSSYDMRLPFSEPLPPVIIPNAQDEINEADIRPYRELISVLATSDVTGRSVIVSVVSNNAIVAGGWNWGVNNVLLILDPNVEVGLSPLEVEQLNTGEVLVNAEANTGKRILRVRPDHSHFGRNTDQQAEAFVSALGRGLAAAESLSVTAIAVVAPTSNQFFLDLPVDVIRSLTVEAVIAFVRRAPVRSLDKIICAETHSNCDQTPAGSDVGILLPAAGDRMASTLMLLLEQANIIAANANQMGLGMHGKGLLGDNYKRMPSLQMLSCNVALPRSLSAETLVPTPLLATPKYRYQMPLHHVSSNGASPIIIRGLVSGITSALNSLRALLAGH
jgi:hypothetical protein